MYRSILVPLDGSPQSEQAVTLAATIAQRAHATVRLVHAHLPQLVSIPDALFVLDTSVDQQQREQEQSYLTGVARQLREQDLHVRTTLLHGAAAGALQAYAAHHAIDLVVMTTHGHSGMSRLWFGSVADQLVRALPMPILLLHPTNDLPADQAPQAFHHVLIPLDGSELAEGCIEHALAFGTLMAARYTLLHIVEELSPVGRSAFYTSALSEHARAAATHAATSYLDQVANRLCERAPHMHIAVTTGRPSEIIPAYAKEHHVDLIAMSTHGRSGFARWYFGSVTTSVLRANTTPLLISKPPDLQQHQVAPGATED